jgi:[ribosomal protein S5]-alanine N-acetyltransferase
VTVPIVPPERPLSDGVITLRAVTDGDLDAVERVFQDPRWVRWFGPGHSAGEHVARVQRDWRESTEVWFAICDAGGDEYRGEIAIRPEAYSRAIVEYWLAPEGRGGGRATRALRLASSWALREGGIARLQLWTEPENLASQGVADRGGYQREGILRKYDEIGGRRVDSVLFSLLPEDLDAGSAQGSAD